MSKRILVVEDQADNRQIIRDMLAPTDYEITEVENGEEALTAIAKKRPDLILMDIQLPVMDGYEATRRIKADPSRRSIPIIAVTSYALSGEEKKAREARAFTSVAGCQLSAWTDSDLFGHVLPNFRQQFARAVRFRYIVVAAGRSCFLSFATERIRRDCDDRD